MRKLKKFDVVLANLNPRKGHAQSGIRPAVVVQSNLFNQYSTTLIVIPLTTQHRKIFPSEFLIQPSRKNGLQDVSRFLGSQPMTLDGDFVEKVLGSLEDKYYVQVQEALRVSLDWDNDFV